MWNIVLVSNFKGEEKTFVITGYDKRPLKFIEKAFAEREAYERNISLNQAHASLHSYYYIVEEDRESSGKK